MTEYALLTSPSANRVYGAQSAGLALAEIEAVAASLHVELVDLSVEALGGVTYVRLATDGELDDHDRFIVSNLSATYALFHMELGPTLRPLEVTPLAFYDSDLVTIQRYSGKTNEQFTHLLVNVATAASRAAAERAEQRLPVRLLDPLCGRGTTLNRALLYGFDAAGVEREQRDHDAYRTFLTTYLKDNRQKHKAVDEAPRRGALAGTRRTTVTIAGTQKVELVRGDTTDTASYFAARSFDVLVADLPYGVQHGAATAGGRQRSPLALLEESLPQWREVLRDGAGMALAWNVKTLPRDVLAGAVGEAGFELCPTTRSFEHVVDRAVTRDVLIAHLRR